MARNRQTTILWRAALALTVAILATLLWRSLSADATGGQDEPAPSAATDSHPQADREPCTPTASGSTARVRGPFVGRSTQSDSIVMDLSKLPRQEPRRPGEPTVEVQQAYDPGPLPSPECPPATAGP